MTAFEWIGQWPSAGAPFPWETAPWPENDRTKVPIDLMKNSWSWPDRIRQGPNGRQLLDSYPHPHWRTCATWSPLYCNNALKVRMLAALHFPPVKPETSGRIWLKSVSNIRFISLMFPWNFAVSLQAVAKHEDEEQNMVQKSRPALLPQLHSSSLLSTACNAVAAMTSYVMRTYRPTVRQALRTRRLRSVIGWRAAFRCLITLVVSLLLVRQFIPYHCIVCSLCIHHIVLVLLDKSTNTEELEPSPAATGRWMTVWLRSESAMIKSRK